MITLLTILAGVVVVLAITAFTGYFVAQEFAYMAVDRSRLAARAQAGDEASARALQVTRRTSFMLSGAQLGITVTGLLVGYVAEPLIGRGIGTLLGGVGVPTGVGIAVGAILAVGLSTVAQMVFGELFPKNLAIARPEPLARRLALSTTLYLRAFGWLIRFFDQASNLLLRAVKIEPVHDVEHSATPRDLEHIVAASRDAGELPRELSTLLDRILDFPGHTAEHAMIPRARVGLIAADEPAAAVLQRMADGHTRYPVVGASADDLIGVITLHDLLGDSSGTARSRCRPAVIVPGSMPLPAVVARLRDAGQEMALVIDEYGGFDGVVTVEDIAEELVGEIDDEHDGADPAPAVPDGDGWLLRGDVHLDEVERLLDVDLEPGDAETLGGAVTARLGALPRPGDVTDLPLLPDPAAAPGTDRPALRAEVRTVERRVPAAVHLSLPAIDRTEDGDE
ncbi:hemolysin family protein [Tsukamurella ocularis]|uniref:hemolysin family protein n=1 Tax=Tsukamurella ocularis TaxID=1970234 RepID=UPI00216A7DFF|nr:hemolysin family protein [Tsukamurella ocularis]MCS3779302.1 CBS domain containing-hemolysin-like protein [Tsukamurella ocularis]MCS3787078.1 CBS domain containing-hemolysin-like protein [Tsukamurella ocularis]MCS3852469.1 CBS domain containing-hemolysin-like protein [Tsukamurella ocularis]